MKNSLFAFIFFISACFSVQANALESQASDSEVIDLVFVCESNPEGWPGLHWAIAHLQRGDVALKIMELFPEEMVLKTPKQEIWSITGDFADERRYLWGYNEGISALELAVRNEQVQTVLQLLQQGVDPTDSRLEREKGNKEIWKQFSALGLAIELQQKEIIHLLIEHGASLEHVYKQNDFRERPARSFDALTYALEYFPDEEVFKILISGAMRAKGKPQQEISNEDIELFKKYSRGPEGIERPWPPLHHAFFVGDYEGAKRLIDLGAHYDHYPYPFRYKATSGEPQPIDEIAWDKEDSRFLELLLEENIFAERIFLRSIEQERVDILIMCVDRSVMSDEALVKALEKENVSIIQLLTENGYVNDKAIESAISKDQAYALDIFLSYGIEMPEGLVNETVLASKPALLKLFVESGKVFNWDCLLSEAIQANNLTVVRFVVDSGFEANLHEAFKLSIKWNREEIYQYLKEFVF